MLKKLLLITVSAGVFLVSLLTSTTNDQAAIIPFDKGVIAGRASWYSKTDPGIRRHTANMEVFDDTLLTAAMWDVPFNQKLRVTNLANGSITE